MYSVLDQCPVCGLRPTNITAGSGKATVSCNRCTMVANQPFVGPTRLAAGANLQIAQWPGITVPREVLALAGAVIE